MGEVSKVQTPPPIDPATYRKNHAAIIGAFPELASELPPPGTEAAAAGGKGDGGSTGCELVRARNGSPTLRVDGTMVHSAYDPQREARRLVDTPEVRDARCVAFYGTGLGYHIVAAAELNHDAQLLVIEPDVDLFVLCLCVQDLSKLLVSGRASVALGAGPESVISLLGSFPSSELAIVKVKALYQHHAEYWERLDVSIASLAQRDETNAATLARFGRRWTKNLIRNLPTPLTAATVDLFEDAFADLPVLLAAAGPGLHEVSPNLTALRDRCVVVAVDTALPYLLQTGIDPDFVVVVDPQYWNSRHLDYCGRSKSIVISESATYPRSLRLLSGPKAFGGSLFPLGKYLEEKVSPRSKLGAGGSVSTSAWDFAKQLGASAVYCAGLDLGFPGYRTHVPGSLYERYFNLRASRLAPAETGQFSFLYSGHVTYKEAADGGTVPSDARMAVYVFWFQMQLAAADAPPTYTLSEHSLAVAGMHHVAPKSACALPVRRGEIDAIMTRLRGSLVPTPPRLPASQPAIPPQSVTDALDSASQALRRIGDFARDGLQLVEQADAIVGGLSTDAFDKELVDILGALDQIDYRIASDEIRHIAAFLASTAIREVAKPLNSSPNTPTEGSDRERSRAALARSRRLYEALVSSVEDHLVLLAEARV